MNEQQIIETIESQLGGGGGGGGGGQSPGFSIATDELTGYVRQSRQLADELHQLARRKINSVQTIAEDSFGRIGKETGFAAALNSFAGALEAQVNGLAKNADRLSDGVAKTARNYRRQDQELAEELLNLLD